MPIKKLFAIIAPIAPAAVEFHIHHVVPAFQMSMLRKEKRKKRIVLCCSSAINKMGTQAINISGVKPASGQADTSKRPEMTLYSKDEDFFKKQRCLSAGKFVKKGLRKA